MSDKMGVAGARVRDGAIMTNTTGSTEASTIPLSDTEAHLELTEAYAAHNYHPLRVVLAAGEGPG